MEYDLKHNMHELKKSEDKITSRLIMLKSRYPDLKAS